MQQVSRAISRLAIRRRRTKRANTDGMIYIYVHLVIFFTGLRESIPILAKGRLDSSSEDTKHWNDHLRPKNGRKKTSVEAEPQISVKRRVLRALTAQKDQINYGLNR